MATLESRLRSLEAASDDRPPLEFIVVNFVYPGRLDAPIGWATVHGERIDRQPGEEEDTFIERVKARGREVQHSTGIPQIFCHPVDEDI